MILRTINRSKHRYLLALVLVTASCRLPWGPHTLKSAKLDEISGIIASDLHQGILYIHNDSGDESRFFAVSRNGDLVSTCTFSGDPALGGDVADCEDITYGPGPKAGAKYIYLGDMGDNEHKRPYITIYRFNEPERLEKTMPLKREALHLRYPDGPRDAETLMADPINKLLYIVSKREDTVGVYTAPLLFKDGDTVTLHKKGSLYFKGKRSFIQVTGGDIAHDGKAILIRTYKAVYFWKRNGKEPIETALLRQPKEIPATLEPNGEAVTFSSNGKVVITTSEGKYRDLNFFLLHR